MSEDVKCLPQLVEIVQKLPAGTGAGCSGSYRIETPLLVSTWEPDSVVASVTATSFRCSGTTTSVDGSAVDVSFGGTGGGATCSTPYFHDGAWTTNCVGGGTDSGTFPNCGTIGVPLEATLNPGGVPGVSITTSAGTSSGCYSPILCSNITEFVSYGITNVRKQNPADPDCEDTVTVRYEGCSKGAPPGTYEDGSPPGGGTPGGGGSPGGSPPPPDESPTPPPSPPSGSGGSPGGGSPPPPSGDNPPPPSVAPPPPTSINTSTLSGVQVVYPDTTILAPAPTPQFPTLIAILPGGEPESIPWNGYAVYPGSETAGLVVVGTTYPTLYVSPMMAQRLFHNWKVLKHVLLQFENKEGTNIQTSLTTTDTAQYGKALHRFNANVGIIYNDEYSDEVIQELYKYDSALWGQALFTKHYSPKQIDDVVSFKESLLGTSYSYQVVVYSSDPYTWRLVGWQIEGKQKGKRRNHGRD